MYGIPEQLVAFNKNNIQAFLDYATLTATSAEKLAQFQFKTSQAALAESLNNARTLAAAKDAQEIGQILTKLSQPGTEHALAYAQHVQGLLGEVQSEFTRFFDGQVSEFNKHLNTLVEQALKSAPAGSDVAVSAVKSALSAANQAYDAASKAGKQLAEMTEATLHAATPTPTGRKKAA